MDTDNLKWHNDTQVLGKAKQDLTLLHETNELFSALDLTSVHSGDRTEEFKKKGEVLFVPEGNYFYASEYSGDHGHFAKFETEEEVKKFLEGKN